MNDFNKMDFEKYFLNKYDLIIDALIIYFEQLRYDSYEEIAKKLPDIINRCDSIDYKEVSTAEAYAIFHLLDRVIRFEKIILELCSRGLIRSKENKNFDVLDVGTGPAPALISFALAHKYLKNDFSCDYVEQSDGFRDFLHHFCEALYKKTDFLNIPYHFGTFDDFGNIRYESNKIERYYDYEDGMDHIENHHIKYRYDTIIFSNFLTTIASTQKYKNDLLNSLKVLRNNGLLVIVGSTDSKKYAEIYDECDNLFLGKKYDKRYYVNVEKVLDIEMKYSFDDEFAEKLRQFDSWIIEQIKNDVELNEKQSWYKLILERDNKQPLIKWRLLVYRKKSAPKFPTIHNDFVD